MTNKVEEQLKLFKTNAEEFLNPKGYKGLSAFHKYWGKKPIEALSFFVQHFTDEDDVVLDPFLGSALISKVSLDNNRRFIGIDVNPISIQLGKLYNNLPEYKLLQSAINRVNKKVQPKIYDSYKMNNGDIATHYLWENGDIKSVWNVKRGKKRVEIEPTEFDNDLFNKFENYESKFTRTVNFFANSRINTNDKSDLKSIFTGRALRNIDILIEAINEEENEIVKNALLLILTASSGQMSKMVFAISRRGKNSGEKSDKIEVGSWVIGYWKPKMHFEVNCLRTFNSKANKLLNGIKKVYNHKIGDITDDPLLVIEGENKISLVNDDCNSALENIDERKIDLIIADPPHSDRIPYLELSEMWNAILGNDVKFDKEIVVSDAKNRDKHQKGYKKDMIEFLNQSTRVLKKNGILILFFNAKSEESWEYLENVFNKQDNLEYLGYLPANYSAKSVVQDNRKGGLKNDFALIFQKNRDSDKYIAFLNVLPNFSNQKPTLNN